MKQSVKTSNIKDTGFGYALKLIGGNFRLPVLFTLLEFGQVRFNDLKRYIVDISSRSLTVTLKEMEEDGLVVRREISHFPLCVEYSLTDFAKTLCPAIDSLTEWGERNMSEEKEMDRGEE